MLIQNNEKWFQTVGMKQANDDDGFLWTLTKKIVDRDGDVILPEGLKLANKKNLVPVLWQHGRDFNRGAVPIGSIDPKTIDITENEVTGKVVFDGEVDGFAALIEDKVRKGILTGGSIGFFPKVWDREAELKGQTGMTLREFELLEFSVTPVPANAQALRKEAELLLESLMFFSKDMKEDDTIDEWRTKYEILLKAVIPHKRHPLATAGTAWNASAAESRVRRWAGGPEKDDVDFEKYRQAFTWYDTRDAENFRAYKLPHHDLVDGGLKTVLRGVQTAMGALLGARGGVDIPDDDRQGVYDHLKSHYMEFDKEPPELKEYAVDDLAEMDVKGLIVLDEKKLSHEFDPAKFAAEIRANSVFMNQQKAGRRLSAATIRLLNQAIEALNDLVKEDENSDDDKQQKQEQTNQQELDKVIRDLSIQLIS